MKRAVEVHNTAYLAFTQVAFRDCFTEEEKNKLFDNVKQQIALFNKLPHEDSESHKEVSNTLLQIFENKNIFTRFHSLKNFLQQQLSWN